MSGASPPIGLVGSVNAVHGVCGFTSTFTALYAQNPGKRPLLINGAPRVTRVLADIKVYLKLLEAAADGKALLTEINQFNIDMYPQYPNLAAYPWTNLADFIERIDDCVERLAMISTMEEDNAILNKINFTLFMPPRGVADFIRRSWGWAATISELPTGLGENCIVGVARPGVTNGYHDLVHWMYKRGAQYWSWGSLYASVQAANPAYTVIYSIELAPN